MSPNFYKTTAACALCALIGLYSDGVAAQDHDVPTYLLANLYVENMDAYMNDYAIPLGPVLIEAGGEILVVTPEVTQLEGSYGSNLTVVVRFPSAEAANAFYASDDYAALRPARQENTDAALSTLVLAPEFAFPSAE